MAVVSGHSAFVETFVEKMSYSNSATDLSQKYAIVAELGQGGMSVVHLAAARGVGDVKKLVVLKSIRPELFGSGKVERMFMDEARLATRLTHPNIVQTYEVVMLGGRPVIVMEYMEGQTFSAVRRRASEVGNFPLAMQLRILCGVLSGLDYAHEITDYDGKPLGLIHRDVSPQNVFVTYDGHAKVLDFGIAKTLTNQEQTEAGELKGKLRYMSPEQMRGDRALDRRADVFAVGVMLWEALAGQRLWQGSTDVEVFGGVLTTGIPRPSSVNPAVNERLELICMKALAREPNDRFPTCAAFQAELESVADSVSLRTSSRDISVLMQALFSEVRSSIRSAVELRLKQPDFEPLSLGGPDSTFSRFDTLTGERVSHSRLGALAGTAPPPSRSRFPWVTSVLVLLLLAGVGGWFSWRRGVIELPAAFLRDSAAPPAAPAPVVAAPPLSAPEATSAEPIASSEASVSAAVAGAAPVVPAPIVNRPRRRAAKAAGEASAAPVIAAPVIAAPPNCERPFYVDESGIRRMRKECL